MSVIEAITPVVLLENAAVNLEAIVELTDLAVEGADNLEANLEINHDNGINIDTVINEQAVDDWFQLHPSTSSGKTRRLPSGRKNIKAIGKSLRSPSPAPSDTSVSAAAEDSPDEDWSRFLEQEQQRRAAEEARRAAEEARRVEWCRRAAERRAHHEQEVNKARELVSSLKGEEKSLRNQREALRAQLRALDDKEHSLDKRKRSALSSMKKHEAIVAKYKAMNI